ncbi:AlpA family transcriptional regulator [Paraburkholderia sp. Cpub6]|uniref:helix-turn-helix transcriptional regulator n=1 Tax=Paraburkholderia sp. Cpub6 TaxID=2723094 RepID=UPI001614E31E|nr:AlpA family phage regulatory protein [Paraburkholderia sp. Cpub6]MBB5456773.1 prophage regulatory protein [Paraburkholderia sp. Cpub6]
MSQDFYENAPSKPTTHGGAAFYRMSRLTKLLDVGRSTLYEWIKAGRFPSPVKLGPKAVGFRAEDVHAWIAAREVA